MATGNAHKVEEVQRLVPDFVKISGVTEWGETGTLPEPTETLPGNAWSKADYVYKKYEHDCFADDTGLEVAALEGRPGVYSARYGGEQATPSENVDKLLHELRGVDDRKAQFRTVIALYWGGEQCEFEGLVKGKIIYSRRGNKGFGYDPVFQPDGFDKTFAEMSLSQKNKISHRGKAFQKMVNFINNKLNKPQ